MVEPRKSDGAQLLRCAAMFLIAGSVLLPIGAVAYESAHAAAATADAGLDNLVVVTRSGRHPFRVETAKTDAQRETGLMYRRSLPADRGMIFDFKTTQSVMMWMKNTYVPLDMIFISRSGVVTHIARNAEPLSEKIIPSEGPAYAVLEVNAGTADKIALQPGDKIEDSLFTR
jgi:uncharacterized membrane protein (UPF0127 family)